MVNPERSWWSEVIIECLERGGEVDAAPLRSHTLVNAASCITIPETVDKGPFASKMLLKISL